MERRRKGTMVAAVMVVETVALLALFVTIAVVGFGGSGTDSAARATTTTSTTTFTAITVGSVAPGSGIATDRLAELEADGSIGAMVQQHQSMLEQMRVSASPQMLELMDNDPMSTMIRSGEYLRLEEDHEQAIDQMLARGG